MDGEPAGILSYCLAGESAAVCLQVWAKGQGLQPGPQGWPTVQVITEHISQADLPRLYAAADAFVLPSRYAALAAAHDK